MTRQLIMANLQEQMNQAAECVSSSQFDAAIASFNECAHLVQMLQLEARAFTEQKQLVIELPANDRKPY